MLKQNLETTKPPPRITRDNTRKIQKKKVHSHDMTIQVVTKPTTEERTSKKTTANERAHNSCALANAA